MEINFSGLIWAGVLFAFLPFVGLGLLIGWAVWG